MSLFKSKFNIFVALLFASVSLPVLASEELAVFVKMCESCHGENGISQENEVPIIGGYSYYGFLDTLTAFRDDERIAMEFSIPGEPAAVMNDIAKSLTDAQVVALAKHFSALPFVPPQQQFDVELAKKGEAIHQLNCDKCHSEGGSNPQDDAAILAGQWMPYLSRQFENIETGKRIVPKKMLKKIIKLSDADKQALVHYYASQGNKCRKQLQAAN